MRGKPRGYLPAALWYVGILILTSIPGSAIPEKLRSIPDLIPHFLAYAVLSWLTARPVPRPPGRRAILARFALALLMGLLDECHQLLVPGRTFSLTDLAADIAGSAAGLTLYLFAAKRKERSEQGICPPDHPSR